ncbi:hypothetical protein C2G38_2048629 [Gigaspora rosea]|uniref:Uncharacterized protein n=1 Tax=Gigaspora rosea TaxID=44941 RepID=A0A397U592_9GLOM|nr:hypothetical protein C2G38_2048629 [Gigaspora rosea]
MAYFTKKTIKTILPNDISAIFGAHFFLVIISSHTVLIALGVLGGGFGLLSGIYILLFGRPRNNPWGLMHFLMEPKIEGDGNVDLLNMPFVSKADSLLDDQIPTERKVTRLENRILALEKILEDYVFDPYALRLLKMTPEESEKY